MWYWVVKALLRPTFSSMFSPRVTGQEHIPLRGGVLVASNHLSMCDSLFLPVMTRRRMTFLAKQEYFTERGLKGRLKATFVTAMGLVPIDRQDPDAARDALRVGVDVLRRGRVLCLYPEGTRSPDGRIYRGKTGVARLALQAGLPIVPVAMVGTDLVLPAGSSRPRRHPVEIRIGPPVALPERVEGDADDPATLRELTDRVMSAIQSLSGQEPSGLDSQTYKDELRARLRAARERMPQLPTRRARADEPPPSSETD